MKLSTICVQGAYRPKNGEPRVVPIVQSTTYKYDSSVEMGDLFDLKKSGYFYSRLQNPTCDTVAAKIAMLEGGVAGMLTGSGQAANFYAVFNIAGAGDHIVSSTAIYGGTYNLFAVTMKRMGIEFTFVDPDCTEEELNAAFKPNTKCVFGETIANPALTVFDIELWAKAAHAHYVPLIVDNHFATPVLCRPIEWGADIVVHSTSKYMDGHAVQVGGVIVDSGKFNWDNGKFPCLSEPDESYHGTVYTKQYPVPYITKARMQLMRDFGCYPAAHSSFLLNLGLETLAVRMPVYCSNAMKVAKFFQSCDKVISVSYPGLETDKYHDRAQKYLPNGTSGVISFSIKGGRSEAVKFMDNLELASNEVLVADIRTCVLHPASATHRQLSDEQLVAAGIDGGLIRFSVGLENVDDIIADIKQAFDRM